MCVRMHMSLQRDCTASVCRVIAIEIARVMGDCLGDACGHVVSSFEDIEFVAKPPFRPIGIPPHTKRSVSVNTEKAIRIKLPQWIGQALGKGRHSIKPLLSTWKWC